MAQDDDEDLEALGLPWGRYLWTILIVVTWIIVLMGWRYYAFPGYKPELWFLLGMAVITAIVSPFLGAFTVLLGAKRIQLGSSALMTVNEDAFKPETIPWLDEKGVPIQDYTWTDEDGIEHVEEIKLKMGRIGGIAFLGIRGKDWAVWMDYPGANVDEGALRKIRVDMQPTPLAELPYPVKLAFVQGGRVIRKGYNPKRSRIWFGLQPMTDQPIPAIHVDMDAALRAANRMIDKQERELRRISGLTKPPEGPVVRIIREPPEGGREIVE